MRNCTFHSEKYEDAHTDFCLENDHFMPVEQKRITTTFQERFRFTSATDAKKHCSKYTFHIPSK